jgi:hypothetical protein
MRGLGRLYRPLDNRAGTSFPKLLQKSAFAERETAKIRAVSKGAVKYRMRASRDVGDTFAQTFEDSFCPRRIEGTWQNRGGGRKRIRHCAIPDSPRGLPLYCCG